MSLLSKYLQKVAGFLNDKVSASPNAPKFKDLRKAAPRPDFYPVSTLVDRRFADWRVISSLPQQILADVFMEEIMKSLYCHKSERPDLEVRIILRPIQKRGVKVSLTLNEFEDFEYLFRANAYIAIPHIMQPGEAILQEDLFKYTKYREIGTDGKINAYLVDNHKLFRFSKLPMQLQPTWQLVSIKALGENDAFKNRRFQRFSNL